MTSAIQLTAASSVLNGQGLSTSANLLYQINTFQSQTPITIIANIFSTVNGANANVSGNLTNSISNIGIGVTNGTWLIDFYPSNVNPTCSVGISYYGNLTPPASFSNTLRSQANAAFAYGMSGFANVYGTVYGYVSSVFDIISSANILQNKTYAQSGIGFNGPQDLSTIGVGNTAPILSNAVVNFGTMYDITKLSNFGDPYIFGQNLLNQGLGTFGNLSTQLSNAGLNINNLSAIPQSTTTTTSQIGSITSQTPIGQINLPFQQTVTNTTTVSGNSSDVVLSIYKSIIGTDLEAIITATQIILPTSSSITSLADFLTLKNVINPSTYSKLVSLGITDFNSFGSYLQSKVGRGTYSSWNDLSTFLNSIVVPTLSHTSASPNTPILANSIVNSINSTYGIGSGPFGNPIITDYLGCVSGYNYISELSILNNNYQTISSSINLTNLVNTLQNDILNYINYVGGNGSPTILNAIITDVNNLNTALNSIPISSSLTNSNTAFYKMLSQLQNEVSNLSKAGVQFNSGTTIGLRSFASSVGATASDKNQFDTYQFFANLVTNDVYGDTIRSAVAENINTSLAQSKGFTVTNDPNPSLIIAQANAQNIPLSTYISQNK